MQVETALRDPSEMRAKKSSRYFVLCLAIGIAGIGRASFADNVQPLDEGADTYLQETDDQNGIVTGLKSLVMSTLDKFNSLVTLGSSELAVEDDSVGDAMRNLSIGEEFEEDIEEGDVNLSVDGDGVHVDITWN